MPSGFDHLFLKLCFLFLVQHHQKLALFVAWHMLTDKWARWMMDLSKLLTIIVSLIAIFCISFMGAWILNDRFLDSGALRNFLSSRPNFSIAIELVVLILKGSLSTTLVMRLTRMEGRKAWKELWCGCHQPTSCVAVHFVVGTASPTCYLGIYPAFGRLPVQWTLLYSTNGEPNRHFAIALFVC